MKKVSLLFNCQLSESRIKGIKRLHGSTMAESVKSINPFKSVIQTSYDIIKAHGGTLKVESKVDEGNPDNFGKGEARPDDLVGRGTTFIIELTK
jgi:hypothetical protein